jgi:hypothetical protein
MYKLLITLAALLLSGCGVDNDSRIKDIQKCHEAGLGTKDTYFGYGVYCVEPNIDSRTYFKTLEIERRLNRIEAKEK